MDIICKVSFFYSVYIVAKPETQPIFYSFNNIILLYPGGEVSS